MQAALGNPEIQKVLITPNINYVLVVLAQGTSQEQLQSIQPDYAKLKAVASYEQVTGMIVTCAGQSTFPSVISWQTAPQSVLLSAMPTRLILQPHPACLASCTTCRCHIVLNI